MLLAANDAGLAGIWFENQRHMPDYRSWSVATQHPFLDQASEELESYFKGQCKTFSTPRAAVWGTDFQRKVWDSLLSIPFGQTTSYLEIAKYLNHPTAVRAIGGAIGRNPWSIMVPCHRVLGSNGRLTGYAGGVDRKESLLQHEGCKR